LARTFLQRHDYLRILRAGRPWAFLSMRSIMRWAS
jgi:hypothetical protein